MCLNVVFISDKDFLAIQDGTQLSFHQICPPLSHHAAPLKIYVSQCRAIRCILFYWYLASTLKVFTCSNMAYVVPFISTRVYCIV